MDFMAGWNAPQLPEVGTAAITDQSIATPRNQTLDPDLHTSIDHADRASCLR
jgi:hypothetical protein